MKHGMLLSPVILMKLVFISSCVINFQGREPYTGVLEKKREKLARLDCIFMIVKQYLSNTV